MAIRCASKDSAAPLLDRPGSLGPMLLVLSLVLVLASMFWVLQSRSFESRATSVSHDLDAAEGELRAHYDASLEYLLLLQEDMVAGRLSEPTFHLRANAYIKDHSELTLMAFADEQFHYAWVAPQDEATRPIIGVPVTIQQEEDAARAAKGTRRPVLSAQYVSIQGLRSVALFVPVYAGERFLGTFSAFFSLSGLLAHAVPEWVRARYEVSLLGAGGVILAKGVGGGKVDTTLIASRRLSLSGSGQELGLRLGRYDEGPDWELMVFAALTVGLAAGVALAVVELSRDNRRKRRVAEDMQRARDLAESASQSKSEFLANISHEIRTPIGAIIGYAEMILMQSGAKDPGVSEMLTAIRRNGQNLLLLINDLLDLTKVEAGLLEIDIRETSLAEVVNEALLAIRPLAEAKGLALAVECHGQVPVRVATDHVRFGQILVNVLSNAVKFTPSGQVELALGLSRDPEPYLVVSVSDTGIGIRVDQQDRLFRNFGQADGSIARRFGGTGLGLALSRKLARLLGGDLVLARTEVGRGSTFTFSVPTGALPGVPMVTTLPIATAPVRVQRVDQRLNGCRILLVEDGIDNQIIYREFLESEGAIVETFADGAQALSRVRVAGAFDLILMDIQLPGIDGYETTREIRALGCHVPVLALTAHAMKGERERCLAAGCDDYLTKPLDMERLIAAVAHWRAGRPYPSAAAGGDPEDGPLVSVYAHDLRVSRVLGGFLERLPDRLSGMRSALDAADWGRLGQIAHALSGTAGSYGFPSISRAAGEVEALARTNRDTATIAGYLTSLAGLHRRARLGMTLRVEGER